MRQASAYTQILVILDELQKEYPQYNMGKHLATALDEYGDVWGVLDSEIVFALTKYRAQLNMDLDRPESQDIEMIIQDGTNLDNILNEYNETND
jgi:hypothetical protein